jgi:acyl-[acyl-carrier-protein] desaturase
MFDDARELDTVAASLLERHLGLSKEWFPHELVPWSSGRDFEVGSTYAPAEVAMPDGVRSALLVNLLTEDNLPHYFHAITDAFGPETAMGEWSRRWAAEEQRHAIVIRDWVTVTRRLDLVVLERARMCQVTQGFDSASRNQSLRDGVVYLALQELATRISHRNTGQLLDDPIGTAVMSRVAADENLHFLFYRDLVSALLVTDPSATVIAIDRQLRSFEMPGKGIPGFVAHAAAIAASGIYNYQVHYEQIVVPVIVRHWGLASLVGLDAEAEQARQRALNWVARIRRVSERFAEQNADAQLAAPV